MWGEFADHEFIIRERRPVMKYTTQFQSDLKKEKNKTNHINVEPWARIE